jgi:AAA domain
MSVSVHINGRPGVGKLTIARELAGLMGARLIDNHSVYNVGLSLTQFKSPEFYEAVRAVRAVAAGCIADLPHQTPLVMTNAHFAGSDWGRENWDAFNGFARARGLPLAVVVLDCSREENLRRIVGESRIGKGALRDPAMVPAEGEGRPLLGDGGDWKLRLDVTDLTPVAAASAIFEWLQDQS